MSTGASFARAIVTVTDKTCSLAHNTHKIHFSSFEEAFKYLESFGYECQMPTPCRAFLYFKHAKEGKEAHLEVQGACACTLLAHYRSAPSSPSPAAGEPPVVLESLDGLRNAACKAIAALNEQAARLKPAADRVDCLDAVLTQALPSWKGLESCGMSSSANCAADVKNFYLLAEEIRSKHKDVKQEMDNINKALKHMMAALELLNT